MFSEKTDAVRRAVVAAGIHRLPHYSGHSNVFHKRKREGSPVEGTRVVRIYVDVKLPNEQLKPEELVPKKITVDGEELETDVVALHVKALSTPTPPLSGKTRPVTLGYSFGHYLITAGTVGAVLYSNGQPLFVTNNHVAANQSSVQNVRAHPGDAVLQPGPYDKGLFSTDDAEDAVGSLFDFVPIDETGVNKVDVALVAPLDPALVDNAYGPPVGSALTGFYQVFAVGDQLHYTGRTSGFKAVTVEDPSADLTVNYESFAATFQDVVVTIPASIGGDSGSGLLSSTNELAGLIFAGDSGNNNGVACKISNILAAFPQLNLTWQAPTAPPPPPLLTPTTVKIVSWKQVPYTNNLPALAVTLENDYSLPDLTAILVMVAKNSAGQTVGLTDDTFVFNQNAKQLTGTTPFATLSYGTYQVELFCLDKSGKIPISPTVTATLVYNP